MSDYDEAFETEVEGIRKEITDAQAKGDIRKANHLFAKEQAVIERHQGTGPIVDGRRTA